jgi:hypothetical protein
VAQAAAEALAADAARWMAGGELPPPPAAPAAEGSKGAASSSLAAGSSAAAATHKQASSAWDACAGASAAATSPPSPLLLPLPAHLPPPLALTAHSLWRQLEAGYLEGLSLSFAGARAARRLAATQLSDACRGFKAFLARPDDKQLLVTAFVERFNAVEPDVRATKEAQVRNVLHLGGGV